MSKSLVEMAADIVKSQAGLKPMTGEEVGAALKETFGALQSLQSSEHGVETVESNPVPTGPAIDPKKSIQKNKIICLECGQEFKMLSPKHLASHGITAKEYRKKYGFSARQPLCAKALSEKRAAAGKERGIPEDLKKSIEARKAS